MRRTIEKGLASGLLAVSLASSATANQDVPFSEFDIQHLDIRGLVELPIDGVTAVDNAGQIVFVSSNGRFVFSGQVYDIWQGKPLNTMPDIQQAATHIYLDGMKIHPTDLNTVTMGEGPLEVTMFTDPLCEHCHALATEAKKHLDDFTIHMVVVPALGDKSDELARQLYCSSEGQAEIDALLNGTLGELSTVENCDTTGYDMTLLAAEILGVNGVPFLIHDDGRVSRGRPANFEQWLKVGGGE